MGIVARREINSGYLVYGLDLRLTYLSNDRLDCNSSKLRGWSG